MQQRIKNLSIILAVVIVAAIGVAVKIYGPAEQVSAPGGALGETYTNTEGQKWGPLPEGARDFQVASEPKIYPQFLSGIIDPVKVAVGDIQKMKIVIADDSPVTSVIAEIETDNDTVTVPLKLTSSKAISADDLREGKDFVINGKNELILKDYLSAELVSYRLSASLGLLRNKFLSRASAESVAQYTYEGEWTVRDTSVRTYHTTFIAKDELGREKQLTLAWSDPCGLRDYGGGNQSISQSCTISTGAEGTDNGNTDFAGSYVVTLSGTPPGGYFVWNPGNSITINNGSSFVLAGGSMKQGFLYQIDNDCDGYGLAVPTVLKSFSTTNVPCSAATKAGRVSSMSGVSDCYDYNGNAYPGSSYFGAVHRGDYSFDYNCDGSGNQSSSPGIGRCDDNGGPACTQFYDFEIENPSYNGRIGFTTVVACGSSGTYIDDPGHVCGNPRRACSYRTGVTNTCIAPQKQYSEGGKCHSYPSSCPADPIPGANGATGFMSVVGCGQSTTYVTDGGGCFPPPEGEATRSCVTQPSGTYFQGCR